MFFFFLLKESWYQSNQRQKLVVKDSGVVCYFNRYITCNLCNATWQVVVLDGNWKTYLAIFSHN